MKIVAALGIAYLLGSVLPADLLARARGVDIRAVGTRNPGATNALHELGLLPGLVTAAYDMSVGLVSMYVASALGLASGWVYVAGLTAILGHNYPLFAGFRGGQGMAAATGMLLYCIGLALYRGWLAPAGLGLLVLTGAIVFALTRSATVVGVVTPPLLVAAVLFGRPDWQFAAFASVLAAFVWTTQVGIARHEHLMRIAPQDRARPGSARPHPGAR